MLITDNSNSNHSYSLNKLPQNHNADNDDSLDKQYSDKVKLLEFSNLIDKWEQELLFSENGLFSIKGKEAEIKSKNFIDELKNFADSKIAEMNFSSPETKNAASVIKKMKIDNISFEINKYVSQQIKQWQINTFSDALDSAKNKALLYKNNPQLIQKSLKNAMLVLDMMAEAENWTPKTLKQKKDTFCSDFFKLIIDDFIHNKDASCAVYFEKYKKYLIIDDLDSYEKQICKLKNTVIAFNWAKELFSYNLSESENEKEIARLHDVELEGFVRNFLKSFKKQKNIQDELKNNADIEASWKKIIDTLNDEPEKAVLFIDDSQKESFKKSQKNYIDKFINDGFIKTDFKEFIKLFDLLLDDFISFKDKNIYDLKHLLSDEDFDLFLKFKKFNSDNYISFKSDFSFIKQQVKKSNIKSDESVYYIYKMFILESDKKQNAQQNFNIEAKNKLIQEIILRFSDKENLKK